MTHYKKILCESIQWRQEKLPDQWWKEGPALAFIFFLLLVVSRSKIITLLMFLRLILIYCDFLKYYFWQIESCNTPTICSKLNTWMAQFQNLEQLSACMSDYRICFIVFNFRTSVKDVSDYISGSSAFAHVCQHHIIYVLYQIFSFDSITSYNIFSFILSKIQMVPINVCFSLYLNKASILLLRSVVQTYTVTDCEALPIPYHFRSFKLCCFG